MEYKLCTITSEKRYLFLRIYRQYIVDRKRHVYKMNVSTKITSLMSTSFCCLKTVKMSNKFTSLIIRIPKSSIRIKMKVLMSLVNSTWVMEGRCTANATVNAKKLLLVHYKISLRIKSKMRYVQNERDGTINNCSDDKDRDSQMV